VPDRFKKNSFSHHLHSSFKKKSCNSSRNLYENGIWASAGAFSWRRKIEEWGLSRSGESWKEKKQAFLHKFLGKLGVSEMGFRFLTCKWVLSEGLLREMEKTQMRERGRDERERRNTKKREVEREREREDG
jgi:hypothetical protein